MKIKEIYKLNTIDDVNRLKRVDYLYLVFNNHIANEIIRKEKDNEIYKNRNNFNDLFDITIS